MIRSTFATVTAAAAAAVVLPLTLAAVPANGANGADGADGSFGAAARVAAKYQVKATIDRSEAVAGEDTVLIKGRVTPKAKGQKVVLQQRLEGKERWKRSGAAIVRKNGKFAVTDDPSNSGTRYYRVVKHASKGIKEGISKEMKLVVYRWSPLADFAPGPKLNLEVQSTIIGTETYPGSFVTKTAGESAHIEYTLGRKCKSLTATYALTDLSASGATGTAKLEADGVTKVWEELAIGTVKEHTTDVSDAFRVLFRFTSSATPAGLPAAAGARVLCTR